MRLLFTGVLDSICSKHLEQISKKRNLLPSCYLLQRTSWQLLFWELFWNFQESCFLAVFYNTFESMLLKQENACSPMNSLLSTLRVPFSFVRNFLFAKCYLTGGLTTNNKNFTDNFLKVRFCCKSVQVIGCFLLFIIKRCNPDSHFRYLFPSLALFNCLII